MKFILLFSGVLLILSFRNLEAPQSATEDSPSDTTIMGGNTPGYKQEPNLEQQIKREREIKKDEKELMKQRLKKRRTSRPY